MTDAQSRLWHAQRKADLASLIDRQNTVDELDRLHRAAGHEFDDALRARFARRVQEVGR